MEKTKKAPEWQPHYEDTESRTDSFNSLCQNLVGLAANDIPVYEEEWSYLARRFASAGAAAQTQPDWVLNPTDMLETLEKTYEGFCKVYAGIANPAGLPVYTLAQLFDYIFIDDDRLEETIQKREEEVEKAVNDAFLDSGYANEGWFKCIYKELAKAISKAYLNTGKKSSISPQKFLKGRNIETYQGYLAYMAEQKAS